MKKLRRLILFVPLQVMEKKKKKKKKTYCVGMDSKKLYDDLLMILLMINLNNLFYYEKGIYIIGKDCNDWVYENPKKKKKNC